MAWYKAYKVPFTSLHGTHHMVYIYEKSSVQEIVTLTGADNPFVTQEDDDVNIFTPIRKQTGYLRVIDMDGTLLENLIPNNNTEKLIRLYEGEYDGGVFTDGNMLWQGFLCADAYTQPWDDTKKVIEFPLKSLLASFEDVRIPDTALGNYANIAKYIVDAFNAIEEVPHAVECISNLNDVETGMLKILVDQSIFFSEETINNQGDSFTRVVGLSYYEVISEIAKLFGIQLREYLGVLYIVMYDNGCGTIGRLRIPSWSSFVNIANGQTFGGTMEGVPEDNMLDSLTFAGNNNVAGFLQGGSDAAVILSIGGLKFSITLPPTEETQDTPLTINNIYGGGVLYVQPHSPRADGIETYTYKSYIDYTLQGDSTYQDMESHSVITGYNANPYANNDPLYTGAFPVRWYYQKNGEWVVLKNGLYLNTQYRTSNGGGNPTAAPCYSIRSLTNINANNGWLNIKLSWRDLIWSTSNFYVFEDWSYYGTIYTEIKLCLQVGNLFWNGSDWVSGSVPDTNFFIKLQNGQVPNNKTSDMNTDEDNGYFIPITQQLNGKVTLHILNVAYVYHQVSGSPAYHISYTHILYDLNIVHILPRSVVSSERSSNAYRRTILSSGFSENKEIQLKVGTINNNYQAACFIKSDSSTFIEGIPYFYRNGQTTWVQNDRPEMNLLTRMVVHYRHVRRTFIAIRRYIYDPFATFNFLRVRFTYLDKKFFGVISNHNWADDTQEVKFIEVT